MINQKEFHANLQKFDEVEKRGTLYPMFINMIENGLDTEAFLFILSTWNFAVFRYAMKNFDINKFKNIIEKLNPLFNKFRDKNLETINFDNYEKEIIDIFDTLAKIKGIQYTGTSKLMHLKCPKVFIMWDTYIRKEYGFNGNAKDYFNFLKKMQELFKGIKNPKDRTLAKCIDEYNYAKFTLPALERNRLRRK